MDKKIINISIHHIKTKSELQNYVNKIVEFYISVFSAPPRNEKINSEEIRISLIHIFDTDGVILIAKDANEVIGLSTAIRLSLHKDYSIMNIEEDGWLHSDSAVNLNYRGTGLGTTLFQERESIMKSKKNYEKRYSRTRIDAFAQNAILKKENFIIVKTIEITTNGVTSSKYIWEKKI